MSARLFLTGMPGAGKSVWGKRLAAAYRWTQVDLDDLITQRTGKPIPAIFREEGEPAFRQYERQALQSVSGAAATQVIVSCGGGTPLFFDNLAHMKRNGIVIYLRATTNTLIRHLQTGSQSRPLLTGGDLRERLTLMLAAREEKYLEAHYIFDVETLTEATFAEIFAACTNRH